MDAKKGAAFLVLHSNLSCQLSLTVLGVSADGKDIAGTRAHTNTRKPR